jgi:hypothetical protein
MDENFENASMETLDYEIVHVVSFSHLQEDCEQELISIHSFESQDDDPQANFQKVGEATSVLFNEHEVCFSDLASEKETLFRVFHDPMARYMENFYNHNL